MSFDIMVEAHQLHLIRNSIGLLETRLVMETQILDEQRRYAQALVKFGLNLQEGQSLRIGAELEHAPFIRVVAEEAYRHGAKFVALDWSDSPLARARLKYSKPENLDYMPEYEIVR